MVADPKFERVDRARDLGGNRRRAVTQRILDQVAHEAREQHAVAAHVGRYARRRDVVARRLLGHERKQVDSLAALQPLGMVEPAGEQDFFDQRVELGHVAQDLGACAFRAVAAEQVDGQSQSGQRGAQLVAGIGQQRAVRSDEPLDALGRLVECAGDSGDLVATFDRYTPRQFTVAEGEHAAAQLLQPPRQVAHHRECRKTDDAGDQRQIGQRVAPRVGQGEGRTPKARRDEAAVGQAGGEDVRRAGTAIPAQAVEDIGRQRAADALDDAALAVVDGDVRLEGAAQSVQHGAQFLAVIAGRDDGGDKGVAPAFPAAVHLAVAEPHERRTGNRHDRQRHDHGEIDLREQAVTQEADHYSPSWLRAKT